MEDQNMKTTLLDASSTRINWKSRKDSSSSLASGRRNEVGEEETVTGELSDRRKALFEPLDPPTTHRLSGEALLPPPDFDAASYPRGWLIGKKRKLVNIDVVESMRRIAVQEMNRKDREIGELNDILDEDSKVLELVQAQLLDERGKTARLERENQMLREQVKLLMELIDDAGAGAGDEA